MKKSIILLVVFAVFLFLGCPNPGDIVDDTTPDDPIDDGGTVVENRSAGCTDSTGNLLGYVLEMSSVGLQIVTSTGYQIVISWEGTISSLIEQSMIYCVGDWQVYQKIQYTDLDGTGTLYVLYNKEIPIMGKRVVIVDDALYTLKDINTNHIATASSVPPVLFKSNWTIGYLSITNEDYSPNYTEVNGYELKTITKTDIGFPSAITLPLVIDWEYTAE